VWSAGRSTGAEENAVRGKSGTAKIMPRREASALAPVPSQRAPPLSTVEPDWFTTERGASATSALCAKEKTIAAVTARAAARECREEVVIAPPGAGPAATRSQGATAGVMTMSLQ